jgi:hypothetical protein
MASLNTSIICFLLYTETKKILFKIGRTDLVVFTFGNTGAIRRELHWVGRHPPPPPPPIIPENLLMVVTAGPMGRTTSLGLIEFTHSLVSDKSTKNIK